LAETAHPDAVLRVLIKTEGARRRSGRRNVEGTASKLSEVELMVATFVHANPQPVMFVDQDRLDVARPVPARRNRRSIEPHDASAVSTDKHLATSPDRDRLHDAFR